MNRQFKDLDELANSVIERNYVKLVRKLAAQLDAMEVTGENDMGLLHRRLAGRYHTITRNMRKLVDELMQDVKGEWTT